MLRYEVKIMVKDEEYKWTVSLSELLTLLDRLPGKVDWRLTT